MKVAKTLIKSLREFKKESILSPVLVSLEVTLECLIPLYMVTMLENIQKDNSLENILMYGGILLVMAAFSLVFGMLAGKYAATASAGFARNLRTDIYSRIQGFSFANIDKFSTSSLVTRMTTDVTNIQNAYMMIVRVAVRCPVMLVISLIIHERYPSAASHPLYTDMQKMLVYIGLCNRFPFSNILYLPVLHCLQVLLVESKVVRTIPQVVELLGCQAV